MRVAIEIVGWVGAILILAAYALLSSGRTTAKSGVYQGLNVAGAAGFIVNSGYNGAYPSAALNVIWMFIGVWALWKNARAS